MGQILDKLTGRASRIRPEWIGEVHDAECRFEDIIFDSATRTMSILCWRPAERPLRKDSIWEELLIAFEDLAIAPTIDQQEKLPYYELSTLYFDSKAKRVSVCFHAGLSIEYPAPKPGFRFRGPTGQKRPRNEMFV
jgi:hypothetical protein